MKPRLRADWVMSIEVEELWIFESWRLSPIRRNSVLEELKYKRLEVIQEVICVRAFWGCEVFAWKSEGWKEKKVVCHQHRGGDIMTEKKWEYWEELYILWRAKDREQSLEERHTVRCVRKRSSHYILHRRCEMRGRTSLLRTEPWIPNQNESRVNKMSWSIVSKAAERPRRQRQDGFCEPIAVMRWSWMYKRDVSVEWCRR